LTFLDQTNLGKV